MFKPLRRGTFLALSVLAAGTLLIAACEEQETDLGEPFGTPAATPADGVGTPSPTPTDADGTPSPTPAAGATDGTATPAAGATDGTATPAAGADGTATPAAGADATATPMAGASPTPQTGTAGLGQMGRFQAGDQGFMMAVLQMVDLADVSSVRIDVEQGELVIVSAIQEELAEQICDNIEQTGLFLFGTVRFEDQTGSELARCDADEVKTIEIDFRTNEAVVETTWETEDRMQAENLCQVLADSGLFAQMGDLHVRVMSEDGEELASCGAAGTGTGTGTGGAGATPTPTPSGGTGSSS